MVLKREKKKQTNVSLEDELEGSRSWSMGRAQRKAGKILLEESRSVPVTYF